MVVNGCGVARVDAVRSTHLQKRNDTMTQSGGRNDCSSIFIYAQPRFQVQPLGTKKKRPNQDDMKDDDEARLSLLRHLFSLSVWLAYASA